MKYPDIREPYRRLQWAAREKKAESASDLHRLIGEALSDSLVRSNLNGNRAISRAAAKVYAKALGVSWLWLLGESASEVENLIEEIRGMDPDDIPLVSAMVRRLPKRKAS